MPQIADLTIENNRGSRDRLESALSSPSETNIVYPIDLEMIDHWVAFRIHKQEFRRADDFPVETDIARIFLPLPGSLGTQYTQSYNSEGIGAAGAMAAKFGTDYREGGISSLVERAKNITMDEIKDVGWYYGAQAADAETSGLIGGFFGGTTGGIIGAVTGQALKGAIAGAGLARNPYMSVIYDSPQFRTHSFQWKFVPRNQKESNLLRDLIYKFKYHSAPSMNQSNKHFFDFPEMFDIDFHYSDYLFNIGPSVLTEFQTDYHAEGQPLYHDVIEDSSIDVSLPGQQTRISTKKAPVSISITATFQEVSPITKETIQESNR